jgi:hypothetical protein
MLLSLQKRTKYMNIAKMDNGTNILILATKSPHLKFNGALLARPCHATAGLEIDILIRNSSVAVFNVAQVKKMS